MPTLNASTARELNNLSEFRQTVDDQILRGGRDAQFELMDALLFSDHPGCFAELSLSPLFRRQWPSAYGAIEEGSQDGQLDFLNELTTIYERVRYRDLAQAHYNTKAKVELIINQDQIVYLWILNRFKNH